MDHPYQWSYGCRQTKPKYTNFLILFSLQWFLVDNPDSIFWSISIEYTFVTLISLAVVRTNTPDKHFLELYLMSSKQWVDFTWTFIIPKQMSRGEWRGNKSPQKQACYAHLKMLYYLLYKALASLAVQVGKCDSDWRTHACHNWSKLKFVSLHGSNKNKAGRMYLMAAALISKYNLHTCGGGRQWRAKTWGKKYTTSKKDQVSDNINSEDEEKRLKIKSNSKINSETSLQEKESINI